MPAFCVCIITCSILILTEAYKIFTYVHRTGRNFWATRSPITATHDVIPLISLSSKRFNTLHACLQLGGCSSQIIRWLAAVKISNASFCSFTLYQHRPLAPLSLSSPSLGDTSTMHLQREIHLVAKSSRRASPWVHPAFTAAWAALFPLFYNFIAFLMLPCCWQLSDSVIEV